MNNQQAGQNNAKGSMAGRVFKAIFGNIGRLIATCIMVGIITGCIVACVMTVYIFSMIGAEESINLDTEELGYTSTMLYFNKQTQEYEELQKLYVSDNNRIWVNSNAISQYVKDAVVATEDKRFEDHQGVDWRRTFGAFLSQFLPGTVEGGGSTITQQLIKNVTGDDDFRIDRKVREIFRALELEKNYSKEYILEAYLNVVPFGAGTNGIETAALTYFGKHAIDLDLAESAAIVGITKYPGAYSPFLYPEKNKKRQEDVLWFMHEQGYITRAEYDKAVDQKLEFKREEFQQQQAGKVMSYFEDHVFNTVLSDLMEQRNWTENYAREQIYRGGYQIYTTVDLEMQEYLEEFYLSSDGFAPVYNEVYPQSCAVIIDPNGKLLAVVGGIGEKDRSLTFNRATMATRHPGSSIKPIGPYALAFEYNRVNWSTIIVDGPLSKASTDASISGNWPVNHYGGYLGAMTVAYAVQQSTNTVAAKLVDSIGPQQVFDFMHDSLNMYNLVESTVIDGRTYSDIGLASMALGALTNGVTPLEMAGAYQIYNNGGTFTTPYCYTRVEDSNGRIVLEADTAPRHVISEDTSVLVNKVLQSVNTAGTGRPASLTGMPNAGKTGTSDEDINQWYIGMTPYYVCAVWLGYDNERYVNEYGNTVANRIRYPNYPPPIIWKSIMEPLHQGLEYKEFPNSENVVSMQFCTETGLLATSNCSSVSTGWYKKNSLPSSCPGHSSVSREVNIGDGTDAVPDTADNGRDEAAGEDTRPEPLRVND